MWQYDPTDTVNERADDGEGLSVDQDRSPNLISVNPSQVNNRYTNPHSIVLQHRIFLVIVQYVIPNNNEGYG